MDILNNTNETPSLFYEIVFGLGASPDITGKLNVYSREVESCSVLGALWASSLSLPVNCTQEVTGPRLVWASSITP